MIDLSKSKKLSKRDLNEIAPSIFKTVPSPEVTDKYTHIPTEKVIDDMELLGWNVVDAKEVKARTKGTVGYQKHLVVFRNDDVVINQIPEGITRDDKSPTGYRKSDGTFAKDFRNEEIQKLNSVYPQILLTNSHDGKNAFQFTAGLFRMICENGIVIADEELNNIKMRHMGYTFEDLQVLISDMVKKLPLTVDAMNKMKEVELANEQVVQLAKDLLNIRVEGTDNTPSENSEFEVITTQRKEDEGNGLWEVFNVVQENIINGNFHYRTKSGKERQARIIKNFKQDMDMNKKMFSKALEYAV
tara:strand:+ start:523 stop:1425 length:903 start_codon:yes stop_codon:yes gene_type:complete